ncbi:FAD-binding oxidoreductase [Candidatus Marinimicrobia bacterium]|nr:FAD-binding oxidoreductase [Candidatus Neomarinimicrobiota bacterium]
MNNYFTTNNIESTIDSDRISPYLRDWSNIEGSASLLVQPKNKQECSMILKVCYGCNIPVTIIAAQTNLTGSATPKSGIILSTSLLTNINIQLDANLEQVLCPVGTNLEDMRNKVLELSHQKLFYPVDPTSRNNALVGGTILCNASGFIPGEQGATRYWVKRIEFLLPNGDLVDITRGDYLSENGVFILDYNKDMINLPIPRYKRPQIKNASGLFSSDKEEIDFIDLVIGSEGILGMATTCILGLAKKPVNYLNLFLCLKDENQAIDLYQYLYQYFNQDMSKISALEYFGHNSQTYMDNKDFLFKNKTDVGVYIKIPIYQESMDQKVEEWSQILSAFDDNIDVDNIIVLNDSYSWNKFFEARHSMPDNALRKTKKIGGVSIITDTIVPPNNYKEYVTKVHKKLQMHNIEYLLFGHLGDCHLHFHLIPSKDQHDISLEVYDYMIDLSAKLGGVYSAEHGTGKRKRNDFRKCYGDEAVKMVQLLKQKIDPKFLLNRGNIVQPLDYNEAN